MTEQVARLSGALADRYRIEREVGAGGMATVYLAQDLRHERKVALKVLRSDLAAVIGAERFLQEIRTTANLQHPHILPLHDSGQVDGTVFYVMPFVEGESLRDRLTRDKQLPVEEAVSITREVADALGYAHERGIIHRDIKPENILLQRGHAMVADFGIALAASRSGGTSRMTETGMSLGTPTYMSPEQAMGERELGPRSDVYALGCVTYEMLCGEPPFTGPTPQAIVARVMTEAPRSIRSQRQTVPESVEAAVLQALEKLPADRFESAKAFTEAFDHPARKDTTRRAATPPPPRVRLTAVLAGTTLLLASIAGWTLLRPNGPGEPDPVEFQLAGGPTFRIQGDWTQPFAISDDGRSIVFIADTGGTTHLWVRTLGDSRPRRLEDTERAMQPTISPDGQWVAFIVGNQVIRKVRLTGGSATTIATIEGITAAIDWASNDELVFEKFGSGLQRVTANGGQPSEWIPLDTMEVSLRRPLVLRRGTMARVLFASTARDGTTRLAVSGMDGAGRQRLSLDGVQALGMIDDHLIYARGDGALMAVGFDARGMRVLGSPQQLSERVNSNGPGTQVALSPQGVLVYQTPTEGVSRLAVGDLQGASERVGDQPRVFGAARFSPDGRRIAVVIGESRAGTDNIWVTDRASAQLVQVTQGGNAALVDWTRDGASLVFIRKGALWIQSIRAGGEPRRLTDSTKRIVDASLVDGHFALVLGARSQLLRISLDGATRVDTVVPPFGVTTLRPGQPRVSPDGRWVAFSHRNEYQVYVRSLVGGATFQVSDEGGSDPVWGAQANRLYYHRAGEVIEAELRTAPAFEVVRRRRIDALPLGTQVQAVSVDGRSLLMLLPIRQGAEVHVVVNWNTEVRRALRETK